MEPLQIDTKYGTYGLKYYSEANEQSAVEQYSNLLMPSEAPHLERSVVKMSRSEISKGHGNGNHGYKDRHSLLRSGSEQKLQLEKNITFRSRSQSLNGRHSNQVKNGCEDAHVTESDKFVKEKVNGWFQMNTGSRNKQALEVKDRVSLRSNVHHEIHDNCSTVCVAQICHQKKMSGDPLHDRCGFGVCFVQEKGPIYKPPKIDASIKSRGKKEKNVKSDQSSGNGVLQTMPIQRPEQGYYSGRTVNKDEVEQVKRRFDFDDNGGNAYGKSDESKQKGAGVSYLHDDVNSSRAKNGKYKKKNDRNSNKNSQMMNSEGNMRPKQRQSRNMSAFQEFHKQSEFQFKDNQDVIQCVKNGTNFAESDYNTKFSNGALERMGEQGARLSERVMSDLYSRDMVVPQNEFQPYVNMHGTNGQHSFKRLDLTKQHKEILRKGPSTCSRHNLTYDKIEFDGELGKVSSMDKDKDTLYTVYPTSRENNEQVHSNYKDLSKNCHQPTQHYDHQTTGISYKDGIYKVNHRYENNGGLSENTNHAVSLGNHDTKSKPKEESEADFGRLDVMFKHVKNDQFKMVLVSDELENRKTHPVESQSLTDSQDIVNGVNQNKGSNSPKKYDYVSYKEKRIQRLEQTELVLQDRVESLTRNMQDLEGKAQSLQLTIDRLSSALTRTEEEESNQKEKVNVLSSSISDNQATIAELEERLTHLQRALTSSEHDRRIMQERLDTTRQALNDSKKQNHSLMERVQGMQNEVSESEVRRAELEGQLRTGHGMLVQRQETEQEMSHRIEKLTSERQSLQERVNTLQRALATIETEKREHEREQIRLEKDKSALQKTLDKVEREKIRSEEIASKSVMERTSLDRSLCKVEEDNQDLAVKVQNLQAQLAEAEQQHAQRLIDLTTRHRAETEMETDRLRQAQMQAERLLESRERANRQKTKGLEETIATLKDQLSIEMRKRQQYIQRSARTGEEIEGLRSMLDSSLQNVGRDPSLDQHLLDIETRKLDDTLEVSSYGSRLPPRRRSPLRTPPTRLPQQHFRRTLSPASMRKMKK